MVGQWKAKLYDMHHVMVSVKSTGEMTDEELFGASDVDREGGDLEENLTDLLTEDENN